MEVVNKNGSVIKSARKEIKLYTDGACSGNPGPGGYGAILIYKNIEKNISGGEPLTTNNKMEIMAVIKGLEALKEPCKVTIYSDSAYVVNAVEKGWLKSWKRSNWRKSDGSMVKNIELWEELIRLMKFHDTKFVKVKGHSDNEYNNKCDKMAVEEASKYKI